MRDLIWIIVWVAVIITGAGGIFWLNERIEVRRRHHGTGPLRLFCLVRGCDEPLERCATTPEQRARYGGVFYCRLGHCWHERRRSFGSEIFRYSPGDCPFAHTHTESCWGREESHAAASRRRLELVDTEVTGRG